MRDIDAIDGAERSSASVDVLSNDEDAFDSGLSRDWFILSTLVGKDFKLKYRRSFLGVAWSVLNPLLMMVVLTAVFSYMFRFDIEDYPLYLILGQILFAFMAGSTTSSMTSIIDAAPLLKKIRVDKLVFPLEKVCFELINFAISLIAVAVVMVYFGIVPSPSMLALPILLVCVFSFSLGVGLVLATLAVFFRDIIHLWSVAIMAWTYATPIFYPVSMLDGWMQDAMQLNPMYHFISYFRDIMMYGQVPGVGESAICLIGSVAMLAIGAVVFHKVQRRFVLYV